MKKRFISLFMSLLMVMTLILAQIALADEEMVTKTYITMVLTAN